MAVSSKISSAVAKASFIASRRVAIFASGRCDSFPTMASDCLMRSVARRGSAIRRASGATASSMTTARRFGSGSPSGAMSADARPDDREVEQGVQDRVLERRARGAARRRARRGAPRRGGPFPADGPGRSARRTAASSGRSASSSPTSRMRSSVGSAWPPSQRLGELLGHPRRRRLHDLLAMAQDRLVGVGRDREAEPARELDGAHHADRVLLEADVGVADRPDEARPRGPRGRRRSR